MHIIAILLSGALYVSALVCVLSGISQNLELQAEVNAKLPQNEQFKPLSWGFTTWQKFRQLQERVLPNSPRPKKIRRYKIIGAILLFSAICSSYLAFRP
jgi:hypothetical protein